VDRLVAQYRSTKTLKPGKCVKARGFRQFLLRAVEELRAE
jgi:hypothetical protein